MKQNIKLFLFIIFFLSGIGCDTYWIINRNVETSGNIDIKCLTQAVEKTKGVTEVSAIDPLSAQSYYGNPVLYFRTDICDGWIKVNKEAENTNIIEIYQTKVGAIKPISKYTKPLEEQFELIANNIASSCGGKVQLKYKE